MDLDKIKKDWQETVVQTSINEDQIERMIDNKGQSAYSKLLRYEKIGIAVIFICMFLIGVFRYTELRVYYLVSCLLILVWEVYKLKFLQKMDVFNMNIIEVSERYLRFRKYVLYEAIIMVFWFLGFFGLFGFLEYLNVEDFMEYKIYFFITVFSIALFVCLFLSWRLYWRHVRTLGNSIKELEELEK